jgi:hypothetical protein
MIMYTQFVALGGAGSGGGVAGGSTGLERSATTPVAFMQDDSNVASLSTVSHSAAEDDDDEDAGRRTNKETKSKQLHVEQDDVHAAVDGNSDGASSGDQQKFTVLNPQHFRRFFNLPRAFDVAVREAPFFDASDADVVIAYYFRLEVLLKHITVVNAAAVDAGAGDVAPEYVITEFLPPVRWAGKHNTISCAAGHHIREARWLRTQAYVHSYLRLWFDPVARLKPRQYSFWAAHAAHQQ